MKKITLIAIIILIEAASIFAQAPRSFKYQAVVRDSIGNIIAGQAVSFRAGIIQDSINGSLIYSETHNDTTNQFGVIVLEIGSGNIETGVFSDIRWGATFHFLKLELDEIGGTNYQFMGTSELLSVPYALNARSLTLTSPNGSNYEFTVDDDGNLIILCSPLPTEADAGQDQDSICVPAILEANIPQYGNGIWSIINGEGGVIADTTNPESEFAGISGNTYTLRWTISNEWCHTEDDVQISFDAPPTIADAGSDQTDIFSPTTLEANIAAYGSGRWTIINGTGGNISEPLNPASEFSGIADSSYVLRWTISTACDSTFDEVTISFVPIPLPCPGITSFTYGGQIYNTVRIGTQCWMKENLNIGTMITGAYQSNNGIIEKYCYSNNLNNCNDNNYGGLYQMNEMMNWGSDPQGICPDNWHIPSDSEWTVLTDFLGGSSIAGGKMKEAGYDHWLFPNTGATNSSGFTAMPNGRYIADYTFFDKGEFGYYWSRTNAGSGYGWKRYMAHNYEAVTRSEYTEYWSLSVRCILDDYDPNLPPDPPSNPDPADGATDIIIDKILSWTCTDPNYDFITYDVFLGETNPPSLVSSGQSENNYNPGLLNTNTTYYWKITAYDEQSYSTEGPVWSFSTSQSSWQCEDSLIDLRNGKTYSTVLIGSQCWMAENLNIGTIINSSNSQIDNDTIEKYCYNNNTSYCDTYGGLYQWDEIMGYTTTPGVQGICPSDWHLPTDEEFCTLENAVDVGTISCSATGWRGANSGTNLKSISGWYSSGNGTDLYGYTLLPGGRRYVNTSFATIGESGYLWSSSQFDGLTSWARLLSYNENGVYRFNSNMENGFSVRCLR